ncbi:acetate/propionate family kinase [Spongisporangium articulatum]|uniref:Acetate kinase n=1 Tax=Spongisporangium articulatum TaxID=3362603 RepID=A0ABW8ALB3_9ACTN
MPEVLVLNSGSSSLKYRLIAMPSEQVLASGLVERIGSDEVPDHAAALDQVLREVPDLAPEAVGHRIVHGGERFRAPTLVDDDVLAGIDELAELAPLHNPPAAVGIRAARTAFPDVPQVAVFDTAFHATIPDEASTYAIDASVAERFGVRRYGFHGTSHEYVSEVAAAFLGSPAARLIVLHLGNGASACAVRDGRSVATSMGLTPMEGLVMGTRGGDLDPGAVLHLLRQGMSLDEVDTLLNKRSGLLGLTGHADMRDVQTAAADGDAAAGLALDVYAHRVQQYIGGYLALLGGLDVLVFTAGVGENSAEVRASAVEGLEHLGIALDPARNTSGSGPRVISRDGSPVTVLVVPTDEELQIARHCLPHLSS